MQGLIGQTIGRYQITEHLGRGGMAEVYKAYQPSLDRYVAIKVMHAFLADDKDFLTRFEREAKVVATLRHPNIVQVYDFDVANGQYYMVMEYIDGVTLKSMLETMQSRGEWVTLDDAALIVLSVGSALHYAHERKMVHRDVKPANVMIASDGHVILTDFGIAKILSATNLTASGAMVGTPSYMSPEQGMGTPGDERSDIYSLGVMLYQLAVGRLPYDADTPLAVVLKHINDPLPIPRAIKPDLPEAVERVILKSIAKSPDDRYQTVDDMIADLKQAMGMAADITPTDSMKRGSAIKLASSTVVGRIGAVTPPVGGSSSSAVATPKPGASPTIVRMPGTVVAQRPSGGETEPLRPARRPAWLIPLIILVIVVLVGGGALVLSSSAPSPTPTASPTATQALPPTPTEFVPPKGTLTRDGVECRNAAGAGGSVSGIINQGDVGEFEVTARSGDLLKIVLVGGDVCWVPIDSVDLGGVDVESIPAAATIATLTPTPSPTIASTITSTSTDTPAPTNTASATRPPATRAPTQPPQPTQPPPTPTSPPSQDVDFSWSRLGDANRSGDDWVETIQIFPSGGDGNYVVFYQDAQVPGPPFFVLIRARGNRDGQGCRNLPTSIRVGSAGKSVQKDIFFEAPPNCSTWWP